MEVEATALSDCTLQACLVCLLVILLFFTFANVVRDRLAAFITSHLSKNLHKSKSIVQVKKKLFDCIEPGSTIVEVGAGSGANFQFYPEGCTVICVEPKVEFEGYILDSLKKRGEHLKSMRLVKGQGENLSSVVDAATVDYVVSTLVMCSVEDIQKSCSEVHKILKPGGNLIFFEHVFAPERHKLMRIYQNIMTWLFTKHLLGNCHLNREPWRHIETCGFSQVNYRRGIVADVTVFSAYKWICYGRATR